MPSSPGALNYPASLDDAISLIESANLASTTPAITYGGSGSGTVMSLTVETRTLLQGAVLAMPLSFPSALPLRVSPATATLLRVAVHTEPGR